MKVPENRISDNASVLPVQSGGKDRLKSEALHGVAWNFLARFGQQGIQFVIGIILARILDPVHYGLIGMMAVFIALSNDLVDGGFGKSLIQRQDTDHLDESSMFYFNVFTAALSWVGLWFVAPLISAFFQAPELTWLLRVLSLNVVFGSLGSIHTILLTKTLNFRVLLTATWTGTLVSGIVGVWMALTGFGVWSLVAQMMSMQFARSLALWLLHSWKPSLQFSWKRLKRLIPFGSNLLFASLLDTIFRYMYDVVIAKLYSPVTLGYYNRAQSLQRLPVGNLLMTINHVMFPVFARVKDDPARVKRGLRKAFRATAYVLLTLMFVMLAVADPLIPVLIGTKWKPAIPFFQLLCIVGMLTPIQSSNMNALKAIGRSGVFLTYHVLRKVTVSIALFLTALHGVEAIILGQIVAMSVNYVLISHATNKYLHYGLFQQVADLAPYLATAGGCGLVAWLTGMVMPGPDWLRLVVQVLMSGVCCVSLSFLFRLEIFLEGWHWIYHRLDRRSPARAVSAPIK